MDLHQWLSEHYQIYTDKLPHIIPGVKRNDMAKWFFEWGFTRGVEVGTASGEFAETLCISNPNLQLTCVDAWQIYPEYHDFTLQEKLNYLYRRAKQRLAPYKATLVREFSEKAAKQFPDGYFDFVYIDANHELNYVIQDLYSWIPKVKKGEIISGHDYIKSQPFPTLQVVEAVHAYTSAKRINKWYVLGRRRGGENSPRKILYCSRTWLWINE